MAKPIQYCKVKKKRTIIGYFFKAVSFGVVYYTAKLTDANSDAENGAQPHSLCLRNYH